MKKGTSNSFVDKEKQVLISVAERIGSTLGQFAALGQGAKKASRAMPRPVRRRRKPRTAHPKPSSRAARRRALLAARDKTRSVPRRK
jgi:hypothetical protein